MGANSDPEGSLEDKEHGKDPMENVVPDAAALKPTWRVYASFISLCVVVLTEALDATSISVTLPSISATFTSSTTVAFTLGSAFLLASLVLQPLYTSLSYIIGRKFALLIGLTLFLSGSIIAGWATNIGMLLGGRIIQGIGAAGPLALSVIILTDMVSLRERSKWLSGFNAMWTIGSVTGPIIGGLCVKATWRWIFWINIPLVVTSLTAVTCFLQVEQAKSSRVRLMEIDYVGALLFSLASSSFFIPLLWGGTLHPWSSWRTLVPLILGLAGIAGFAFYEARVAAKPFIPLRWLFSNRTACVGYFGIFVNSMVLLILIYYLPVYYIGLRGYEPSISGVAALPETLTIAPAAVAAGIAVSQTGKYRELLWIGWILATLGMGLLCILDINTSIPGWVFLNLIPGIGLGIIIPTQSIAIQAATEASQVGYAASMTYLIRAAGQAFGVAIASAVFQNQVQSKLRGLAGTITVESVIRLMDSEDSGDTEMASAVLYGLRCVWGTGCALAGIAGVWSAMIRPLGLDQETPQPAKNTTTAKNETHG